MARRKYKARKNISRFAREKGRRFTESDALDLDAMAMETVQARGGVKIPRYYFTLHDIDKVGVRPFPGYKRTPLGVYAYPLTAEYLTLLRIRSLPYRQEAKNVTVLEIADPGNCLVILKLGNPVYFNARRRVMHDYGHIEGRKYAYLMNLLLRKDGYTSVYDLSTGTIHANEPRQICFLEPSAYRVVQSIPQSLVRAEKGDGKFFVSSIIESFKKIASDRGLKAIDLGDVDKLNKLFGTKNRTMIRYAPGLIVQFTELYGKDGKFRAIMVSLLVGDPPDGVYTQMLGVLNEFMLWATSPKIPLFLGLLIIEEGLRTSGFPGELRRISTMNHKDDNVLVVLNNEEQILVEHRFGDIAKPYYRSILISEDATDQVKQKVWEWTDAAPNLFSVSVVPVEDIRDRVDAMEVSQTGKKEKKSSSVAKSNRGRFDQSRYMLRDLDDPDWVFPLDASSDEEAMVEARKLVGNRTGNYYVTRTEER